MRIRRHQLEMMLTTFIYNRYRVRQTKAVQLWCKSDVINRQKDCYCKLKAMLFKTNETTSFTQGEWSW